MTSDVKDNVDPCFTVKQSDSRAAPESPDSQDACVVRLMFSPSLKTSENTAHFNPVASISRFSCGNIAGFPKIPSRKHNGFSLIEVMISVLLLTTSILGLAALQTVSTKLDHQALMRTRSILQAEDMVDRMRANPDGVRNQHYQVSAIPDSYSKNCGKSSIVCTAAELAGYDLVEWNSRIRDQLPDGQGSIFGYTSTSTWLVMVSWTEQSDAEPAGTEFINPCNGGKNEALHCFKLEVRL